MARKPREISMTGVYHVCMRGVNKQRIFEYPEDYEGFFRILNTTMYKDKFGQLVETPNYDLYAYCLMDNHVHLLIGTRTLSVGDVIRRIATSYAQFFNNRYHRLGHLFQDRFRSEVCHDATYFYTLLTYIHKNPVKSGICQYPDQYRYSSYEEIVKGPIPGGLISFAPNIFDVNEQSIKEWVIRINEECRQDDSYSDVRRSISNQYRELRVMTDRELTPEDQTIIEKFTHWGQTLLCNLFQAKQDNADAETLDKLIVEALLGLSGVESITDFQQLDKKTMRGVLAQVRDAGISIRRLSRVSGISEGIIRGSKNPKNLQH